MLGLKKSLHDRIAKPAHERVLGARLSDIDDRQDFIVASFHAAPLTALNSLRRHQIRAALTDLAALGEGLPQLMVGDYNYPIFKENLGQAVRDLIGRQPHRQFRLSVNYRSPAEVFELAAQVVKVVLQAFAHAVFNVLFAHALGSSVSSWRGSVVPVAAGRRSIWSPRASR